MTIAASFQFDKGVLLCADRLITHGTASESGSFSSYEEKFWEITCPGFSAVVMGAGDVHTLKAVANKTLDTLWQEQGPEEVEYQLPVGMPESALAEAIEEVYSGLSDQQTEGAGVLLAVHEKSTWEPVALCSSGQIITRCGAFEVLGIGETSLANFLRDTLYRPQMNEEEITTFAALFVHSAKTYCSQYCGGETDIKILKQGSRGIVTVHHERIHSLEAFFRQHTKDYITDLLDGTMQSIRRSSQ